MHVLFYCVAVATFVGDDDVAVVDVVVVGVIVAHIVVVCVCACLLLVVALVRQWFSLMTAVSSSHVMLLCVGVCMSGAPQCIPSSKTRGLAIE